MLNESILNYLNKFKKLAFAVSGGKDSMALLHAAIKNLDKEKIIVVTVHHNLRQEEGKRDRDFVIDFCKKSNIQCLVYEEQIKEFAEEKGYTIEQAARIKRREIFKEIVEKDIAQRVVLAHHKDDQVESILMHIFRGSGLQGLCGMELDNGILLRPLLDISQKEILEYVNKNNIEYVEDSTNAQLDYARNKIRNVVISEIEKAYPNFKDNILKLSEISIDALDYINSNAPKVYEDKKGVYLKIKDIAKKDITSSQAIINAVEKLHTKVNLEKCHIELVYSLLDKENGKSVMLPFDTICIKEYENLYFYKKTKLQFEPILFSLGEHVIGNKKLIISETKQNGLRADLDKIKNSVIRLRQEKDSFKKFKGGRKSLGDYLTDKKVPKRIREELLVIADNKEVLAVLPYEISDNVKIDDSTKKIVYISLQEC